MYFHKLTYMHKIINKQIWKFLLGASIFNVLPHSSGAYKQQRKQSLPLNSNNEELTDGDEVKR